MPSLDILISGAGITGPVLAYFLAQSPDNHTITIVERSPSPRLTGQNVDLRGNGLEVIRRMGSNVEQLIRAKTTHEQGLRFIDGNNTVWAEFPVDKGHGFTSEIEIMRGDLASILYDATKDLKNVHYVFNEYIASLSETKDGITATFTNSKPPTKYDIIIGADGWSSRTRDLAFPSTISTPSIHSLGQYTAYFKIPYDSEDGTWAQWYNAPGGRLLLLRPDPANSVTRVWLSSMSQTTHLESLLSLSISAQKSALTAHFADAGWRTPRILTGMATADDFYFQKIAQVKLSSWSHGRVVLVGDAAYAPSPITGMGTTAAITGAYVLANEIVRCPEDHVVAFQRYDKVLRGFIDTAQKLMPGTPGLANPQTWWGIKVLNLFLWVVMLTGLNRMGGGTPASGMTLPEYEAVGGRREKEGLEKAD